MFALIPNPEGEIGQITVVNRAGTQVLDHSNQVSTVRSADDAPSPPSRIDETEIERIFGEALAVRPPPPVRFILYFKHDSEDLTPESGSLVPKVVRTILERRASAITIIGHTDTLGDRQYNYQLSLGRARKVANLLASQGIDQSGFEVESHGEDNPLVKTRDEVQELRNRRVEITVW